MNEFTHVIYHSADLDGHCSGALAMLENPDATPVPWDYGQALPDIPDGSRVFMADVCFEPFKLMVEFAARMERLVWVDHHRTAINAHRDAGAGLAGLRAEGLAACELCWLWQRSADHLALSAENRARVLALLPQWVMLLGRWDVWDHTAHELVRPFQHGMRAKETDPARLDWSAGADGNIWLQLKHSPQSVIAERVRDGWLLMEADEKRNRMIGNVAAFETTFRAADGTEYPVLAYNNPIGGSGPVAHLAGPEHAMIVRFGFDGRSRKWSFSLYRNEFYLGDLPDCGAIAKGFGGGGHLGAAGFSPSEGAWPFQWPQPVSDSKANEAEAQS